MNRDIIAMLESLKVSNIKLGLISNCTEEEVQGWSGSDLLPYWNRQ